MRSIHIAEDEQRVLFRHPASAELFFEAKVKDGVLTLCAMHDIDGNYPLKINTRGAYLEICIGRTRQAKDWREHLSPPFKHKFVPVTDSRYCGVCRGDEAYSIHQVEPLE